MDFFEAQDSARTRTRTLVVLFVAAVAAIIAAVYFLLHATVGPGIDAPVDPALLAVVSLCVIVLVGVGSATRTAQLRQGGPKVAELLGGRRVTPNTTDEHERRLVNVVEEMAIASGTPMPAIYVLDNEDGINAFAAGYTLDDAAVAVTRGALHQLNRDELQGVIAHEFSHILNADMRLNIRLMGLLFGILLLAVIGRGLLHGSRGGRRGRDGAGQLALVAIGLIAVGYIGVFFGRLIQAAVSRQREYLADASAVQFTRAPEGIAGALKKIGGVSGGSRIQNHHAAEAGHFFFANGVGRAFVTLLATHPPLDDRIKRIDRAFAGQFAGRARGEALPVGTAFAAAGVAAVAPAGHAVLASVGNLRPEHVAYAHDLLDTLPPAVLNAAHDPVDAPALLFALLTSDDAGDASARIVQADWDASLAARAAELRAEARPLGGRVRLPLVDIILPALRALGAGERERVRATSERLIGADGRTDAFELAVYHIVNRQLAGDGPGSEPSAAAVHSLTRVRPETELVLSAVAWSGAHDELAARAAFEAGARALPPFAPSLRLVARGDVTLEAVDRALRRMRAALAGVRRQFLEGCVQTITHDGSLHVEEGEMLRAVAEALDCPMPPLTAGAAART